VHLVGFYYKNRLYVGVYLQGVLVMQAWFCLIDLTLLQCCSMIHNVGVMITVLTVSVMMVMVMMTITTIGACVGFQRRDRAPNELQQIDSYPVPHLALYSTQMGEVSAC
jgi:hypothetical protein